MKEIVKKIKVLITDVDGVLTDGGLYYNDDGQVFKRFHVQDGLGVKLAQMAGLKVIVVTGLKSGAVRKRIEELGIKDYYEGHLKKEDVIRKIHKKHDINFYEMAYLGDDWVDASAMKLVGLPMAVKNAQVEIKNMALWVSEKNGGEGAFRDAVNFILNMQGKLKGLWTKWLNQHF